jgi:hypothetical protein
MGDVERLMFEGADEPATLYARAKVDWLPRSSVATGPDSGSKWLDQLGALAEQTRSVLAIYNQKVGPDVGGRTNLHKELFNSPEYVLISYGWRTFENFKPGLANTSEGGAFHLFLQQVYEYATGKGANEKGAPSFIPKIKRMLKPLRAWAQHVEHLRIVEAMEATFLKQLASGTSKAKLRKAIEDLEVMSSKLDPKAYAMLKDATRKRSR